MKIYQSFVGARMKRRVRREGGGRRERPQRSLRAQRSQRYKLFPHEIKVHHTQIIFKSGEKIIKVEGGA